MENANVDQGGPVSCRQRRCWRTKHQSKAGAFKCSILRELYESSCLCRKRLAAKCGVDAANAWFLDALKELCREGKICRLRQKGRPASYILSSYDVSLAA